MRKYDAQSLSNKIEWEGGIIEALNYGIRSEEIEDAELSKAWSRLEHAYGEFDEYVSAVEKLLPNAE